MSRAWSAEWVWLGPGDLRPGAWVVLEGGRIGEILARRPSGMPCTDLGPGLLLPGLVNAHTHLELSFMAGMVPPRGDFVDWLERLVALRPGPAHLLAGEAAREAAQAMAALGVVLAGDITNTGKARAAWAAAGVSAVSFFEALGMEAREPPPAEAVWRGGILDAVGVAAHSPYSVPGARIQTLKARAGANPFCIHLAESRAEVEFLAGAGPEGRRLEAFLRERGLARDSLGLTHSRPLGHLLALGVLDPKSLMVHGVQLGPSEVAELAATGAPLCVCPRSNLGLTGGLAPVDALLSAGVPLALGTDSLASAPDLNLWAEMATLYGERPGLAPEAILTMATSGGARALGQEAAYGRIAPSLRGPLAFAPLAAGSAAQALEQAVAGDLTGTPRRVE